MGGRLWPHELAWNGRSLAGEVFVETGTFEGETLLNMVAGKQFQVYHSIELVPEYYEKARAKLDGRPFANVFLHLGSSPDILAKILDGERPTTFWLDAHYQGLNKQEIHAGHGECPLRGELAAIMAVEWKQLPVIIIDDAILFNAGIREKHEAVAGRFDLSMWPPKEEIAAVLGPAYEITEKDDRLYCIPRVA